MLHTKVEMMGLCKLCLRDRPLVEGHVLSEFLYHDLYDQNRHKFHQLHADVTKRNIQRSKGLYDRMLCDDCDNRIISAYETYASKVLNGGAEIVIRHKPDRIVVSELEYAKFKLFQVSLLWRSVISTMDEFTAVSVTPEHAERMRLMLLNCDPGEPHDYGCVLMIPEMYNEVRQVIMPPDPIRISGHRCFRLLAGGLWWLYVVSRHSSSFEKRELFLSRDGTLSIVKERASTAFMRRFAADLVKNPTFPKPT
ncbi:MAG: hypothetical protein M1335_07790 [Chloroflexi bacterium]|nr:hypothetical protein [Chloroflexota bacterium]